jgi:hypothetical protein
MTTKKSRYVVLWTNARDEDNPHKVSGSFTTEDEAMRHIGDQKMPGWEPRILRLIRRGDLCLPNVEP